MFYKSLAKEWSCDGFTLLYLKFHIQVHRVRTVKYTWSLCWVPPTPLSSEVITFVNTENIFNSSSFLIMNGVFAPVDIPSHVGFP